MAEASPQAMWAAQCAAFAQDAAAADWVQKLRRRGAARFAELRFPSRREAAWSHTDLHGLAEHAFVTAPAPALREADAALTARLAALPRLGTRYTVLQEQDPRTTHIGQLHARLGRGARLHGTTVATGGALARHEMHVPLLATDSECSLRGVALGARREQRNFEAGTPDIAGVIALAAALDYVHQVGLEGIAAYEAALLQYAVDALARLDGIRFIGTAAARASVVSFVLEDAHPHDVGTILDQDGIAIRTGLHCAQPVMQFYDVPATARASLAFYNTEADVDALVAGLLRVQRMFARHG